MSNLTDFFPSGGGGLTPKFEEFNSSGTFTPSQALIDAGGYIEIFLVGGGGRGSGQEGGTGGEVLIKKMYLTSTVSCSVTIGANASSGNNGGNSFFGGASAGGDDITSNGGRADGRQSGMIGASWGGRSGGYDAGPGVFGYGAGGGYGGMNGVGGAKSNSGQGANNSYGAGSGYCLIKWYE